MHGLRQNKFRKIVVATGAGVSVSAGIPDFRSPGTGLYDNLQKYDLPNPQAIFDLDYFREKPEAFYNLAAEFLDLDRFVPTPAHYFIKMLADKGLLQRAFTQNIDSLEAKTGIDMQKKVIQAHGANRGAVCSQCGEHHDPQELQEKIRRREVMRCQKKQESSGEVCNGPIKPEITFFGESLPPHFFEGIKYINNV